MLAIQVWMDQNMLQVNPSGTEVMIIHTKVAHILLHQNLSEIDFIRNIGVAFDPSFSSQQHVSNICKSSFYHIRDLRRFRIQR